MVSTQTMTDRNYILTTLLSEKYKRMTNLHSKHLHTVLCCFNMLLHPH